VVADEVRTLAAEAGKSAREVAELVSDLRTGIEAARARCNPVRPRCATSVASRRRRMALSKSCIRACSSWATWSTRRRKSREARPPGWRRWHNRYSKSPVSRQLPLKVPTIPPRDGGSDHVDGRAYDHVAAARAACERLRAGMAHFSVLQRDQRTVEHQVRPAAD